MVRINLLPWREEERVRRQNEFVMMLGAGLVVSALIAAGIHFYIEGLIERQNQRNSFLTNEIQKLEDQIKAIEDLEKEKKNLESRMDVITNLQKSRPGIVHLFDTLVSATPDGLYLTKVVQKGRSLVIEGRAQSNARVSAYMRNIDSSTWLQGAILEVIEQRNQGPNKSGITEYSRFSLKAQQVGKDEDEEDAKLRKTKGKAKPKPKAK